MCPTRHLFSDVVRPMPMTCIILRQFVCWSKENLIRFLHVPYRQWPGLPWHAWSLISFFEECASLISLTLYLAQIFAYTLRTSDHIFNGSDSPKIYQFASSKIELVVTTCGHRCGPGLDQSCTYYCLYFSSFNAHMHSSLFQYLSLLFK